MKERKVIHFLNPTLFTDIFIQSFKKLPFNSEFYILTKEDIDKAEKTAEAEDKE